MGDKWAKVEDGREDQSFAKFSLAVCYIPIEFHAPFHPSSVHSCPLELTHAQTLDLPFDQGREQEW